MTNVVAARIEPGDIPEDAAADAVARALAGAHVRCGRAFTGRANFYAEAAGLCVVDRAAVERLNLVDETITLATLEPDAVVKAKEMVATVKIIPFAVSGEAVRACAAVATKPIFHVAPFRPKRVALIQTRLPGLKESILDKTVEATRSRLAALDSTLVAERRCAHSVAELEPEAAPGARREGAGHGAGRRRPSAILDRRDVIPASPMAAGGGRDRPFRHAGRSRQPAAHGPGRRLPPRRWGCRARCARSPRVNWLRLGAAASRRGPPGRCRGAGTHGGGRAADGNPQPAAAPRARATLPETEGHSPDAGRPYRGRRRIGALGDGRGPVEAAWARSTSC